MSPFNIAFRSFVSTLMLLFAVNTVSFAQQEDLPELRPAESFSGFETQSSNLVLKGAVTNLTVSKGRSQIVKFAQPVTRVSIADPEIADVVALSPDQVMINGRQRGATSFIVWDENGQEGIFDLLVQNDTSELMDTINKIAPGEPIETRITDDSFIVSGEVSNSVILDQIRQVAYGYGYRGENFIDLTDTPQIQVALKVQVIEMTTDVARTIKTAFDFIDTRTNDVVIHRLYDAFEATDARPVQTNPTNVGGVSGVIDFGNMLDTAFDLNEIETKTNILAEPELITTHGRTASFLAGGEFPFIKGITNNGQVQIEFKEFGVKLDFTPWVNVKSGLIEMKIAPEVSSLDNSNCIDTAASGNLTQLVCGLLKRRTETTVQLRNGEGLMISGILNKQENDSFAKIPFIGDIPILGRLFNNSFTDHLETELIVMVRPTIINKKQHVGKYIERSTLSQKVSERP